MFVLPHPSALTSGDDGSSSNDYADSANLQRTIIVWFDQRKRKKGKQGTKEGGW